MTIIYKCPHGHTVKRAASFGEYYCPTCDEYYSFVAVVAYEGQPEPKVEGEQLGLFAEDADDAVL